MRKFFLTTAVAVVLAAPAAARDGQPYVGIEGGILLPRDQRADANVVYTTTQTPASPAAPAGPASTTFNNALNVDYRHGVDVDAVAGYDFGFFRLEGEFGWKRAKLDDFEISSDFISGLNTALNRPSAAPDPGAPGFAPLVAGNFDFDGRAQVFSGMVNGLVDVGDDDGLSFYAGGGAGRARVKFAGDKDNVWAYQLIAGARYAITPNIDFGLKYRYFQTGRLDLADDSAIALSGNPNRFVIGPSTPTIVDQTTNAAVFTNFDRKFRSHSLLASLIFNFGSQAAPPPPSPPAPPPPPPPPPPPTQTCPDGSVVLATDVCPVPPPPPPPPPPAPERG